MSLYAILGIIIGVFALLLLGIVIYYLITKKRYKANKALYKKDQIVIKPKSSFKDTMDVLYQALYNAYVRFPVIKLYAKKTRLKLEMVNDYTEYQIRIKTASIITSALILVFGALFLFLNVVDDLFMILVVSLMVFIVADVYIDSKVNKIAEKILRQIPEVFTEVRHSFHEHGMVEEAFNDAIENLEDKEITPQIRRIKDALLSDNPDVSLEKYYDTAPNRFLKLFAGLSYLTMELGDRKVNNISIYLKNLENILNDVYLEILKQDQIKYRFSSLNIISVIPVLFIGPIRSWCESNFSALMNFYASGLGFLIKSLIVISVFAAYFMLKMIKEDSNQLKFDKISGKRWQERLYRIPVIRQLVRGFMPNEHTRKYKKLSDTIKSVSHNLTMEWFYVNKITYTVIGFVVMIVLCLTVHSIDLKGAYTKLSEEFLGLGQMSDSDLEAAEKQAEQDALVIKYLKGVSNPTNQQIEDAMKEFDIATTDENIARIKSKLGDVETEYLKFWEVLIAVGVASICYIIPDIIVRVKAAIRAMEKEDEVMQFQSIILMLMYIERVDVQTILEWLERYSYAFRDVIGTALNNYEAGAVEALTELKDAVPSPEFRRMVEALISSVERIPIRDAFDELETERVFQYNKRKDANERMVNKKAQMGKAIGFTPMIILIGGYFVGPLMIVSVLQMVNSFSSLGMT